MRFAEDWFALMKKLLLLVALGLLGYYGYTHWLVKPVPPPPPPPPPVETAIQAKPEPVNFAIKSRVRQLLAEWKRRNSGVNSSESGSATIDPAAELAEIRKTLFREGTHSEAEVSRVVSRALRELGVAESEVQEVTRSILGMR